MGASLPFPGTCYPPRSERHQGGRRIIGSWPSFLDNLLIGLWEISGPRQIPGRHGCFPWFTMRILGTKIGFYPVLQELVLFKQLTEHCLASVSPCLQWPGSSHSPDSQNFPGNSMRWWAFQALPRFLLGLIYLGWAWKAVRKGCPNTENHASDRLGLVTTPQAGRVGVYFWPQLPLYLICWDFPSTRGPRGLEFQIPCCFPSKLHLSLDATQTSTQPVWV